MHTSAMKRMEWFIQNYIPKDKPVSILDVGSYNVNGCYKDLFKSYPSVTYTGLDMTKGPNVDYAPEDPYIWKDLRDNSFDFVISGNAFEHIEFPWLTIKEIERVLKPSGVACILAPFAHVEHRYPTDCYRYYPDGLIALAKWAGLTVIESTVGGVPKGEQNLSWVHGNQNYDDSVLIAAKGISANEASELPKFGSENRVHTWS